MGAGDGEPDVGRWDYGAVWHPVPLENPAESAVYAALEMIEMVDLFDQQQAALGRAQIRIGVGIATGQ